MSLVYIRRWRGGSSHVTKQTELIKHLWLLNSFMCVFANLIWGRTDVDMLDEKGWWRTDSALAVLSSWQGSCARLSLLKCARGCLYICVCARARVRVCVCVCFWVCVRMCVFKCLSVCMHAYVFMHSVCVLVYMHKSAWVWVLCVLHAHAWFSV